YAAGRGFLSPSAVMIEIRVRKDGRVDDLYLVLFQSFANSEGRVPITSLGEFLAYFGHPQFVQREIMGTDFKYFARGISGFVTGEPGDRTPDGYRLRPEEKVFILHVFEPHQPDYLSDS